MDQGPEIPFFDKILHFGYFGIGGALLAFISLAFRGELGKPLFFIFLALGMSVGALDEWHQSWVPGRTGSDLGDFIADSVGTLIGLLSAQQVWRVFISEPLQRGS